jgi:hypothetical protein
MPLDKYDDDEMYSRGRNARLGQQAVTLWAVATLVAGGAIGVIVLHRSVSSWSDRAVPDPRVDRTVHVPSSAGLSTQGDTAQGSNGSQAVNPVPARPPVVVRTGVEAARRPAAIAARAGGEEAGITLSQAAPPGTPLLLSLTNYRATRDGSIATVVMRVTARNLSSAPVHDLTLIMADGRAINVGTIPPGRGISSNEESLSVDASRWPSRHFSTPVTLRFSHQGEAFEQGSNLALQIPETMSQTPMAPSSGGSR